MTLSEIVRCPRPQVRLRRGVRADGGKDGRLGRKEGKTIIINNKATLRRRLPLPRDSDHQEHTVRFREDYVDC